MAVSLTDLRNRSRVLADLVGDTVLLDTEYDQLVNDGIRALWADVTSVNKDFRVSTFNFVLSSTNFIDLAAQVPLFREVRAVRRDPGTQTERRLNKWGGPGVLNDPFDRGYRLQGSQLYIDPLVNSAGTYDLQYTPQPPVLPSADFTARLATAGIDLMTGNYTVAGGPGVGRTMTSTVPGAALVVDGGYPAVGDVVLVKDPSALANAGLYSMTVLGVGAASWTLVRLTTFDQNSEIKLGAKVYVTEGVVNASTTWSLTSFSGVDASAMVFTTIVSPTLDAELEQHQDYIVLYATVEAMGKMELVSDTFFRLLHGVPGTNEIGARGRVMRWASDQRTADPEQIELVRNRGRRVSRWDP